MVVARTDDYAIFDNNATEWTTIATVDPIASLIDSSLHIAVLS